MLLELLLVYLVLRTPQPAPREPIVIPVAAEDLARCQATLGQVLAGPMVDDDTPGLTLATQPARTVVCVVEETAN